MQIDDKKYHNEPNVAPAYFVIWNVSLIGFVLWPIVLCTGMAIGGYLVSTGHTDFGERILLGAAIVSPLLLVAASVLSFVVMLWPCPRCGKAIHFSSEKWRTDGINTANCINCGFDIRKPTSAEHNNDLPRRSGD